VSDSNVEHAVARLDAITRRLRRECPWDREQDERSIVPHTVEEAYELADAAHAGDDAKLLDELGDVLFQVHFLALLLEERGAGDLPAVADHATEKLIRRHPHVFGEVAAETSADVLRNWDQIKSTEPGRGRELFGDVPENLPALLYARKLQRRAASAGADPADVQAALQALREELAALESEARSPEVPATVPPAGGADPARAAAVVAAGESARPQAFRVLGDVLFACVEVARKLRLDPELALRASSQRFQERVAGAERPPA
jgi:MazG family protein